MASDPFDDLLHLEDQFYQEGYREGVEDGISKAKVDGWTFGLEKGFEQFLESGRLYGKALIWASRLPGKQDSQDARLAAERRLPPLPDNPRLEKNIAILLALLDPQSLSTENTEEAATEFEERMRKAKGRAKVIEKMIGEDGPGDAAASPSRKEGGGGGAGTAMEPRSHQPLAGASSGW